MPGRLLALAAVLLLASASAGVSAYAERLPTSGERLSLPKNALPARASAPAVASSAKPDASVCRIEEICRPPLKCASGVQEYLYAYANPTVYWDPDGREAEQAFIDELQRSCGNPWCSPYAVDPRVLISTAPDPGRQAPSGPQVGPASDWTPSNFLEANAAYTREQRARAQDNMRAFDRRVGNLAALFAPRDPDSVTGRQLVDPFTGRRLSADEHYGAIGDAIAVGSLGVGGGLASAPARGRPAQAVAPTPGRNPTLANVTAESSTARVAMEPVGRSAVGPSSVRIGGESTASATGKAVHSRLAAERRASGDFDLVNQPIVDASGTPVRVTRRTDLGSGRPLPESGYQTVRPDAVRLDREVIIDDKPIGRSISKDRQEMIRYIRAYEESHGSLPRTIGIQRYDPATGRPFVTELFSPEDFLR